MFKYPSAELNSCHILIWLESLWLRSIQLHIAQSRTSISCIRFEVNGARWTVAVGPTDITISSEKRVRHRWFACHTKRPSEIFCPMLTSSHLLPVSVPLPVSLPHSKSDRKPNFITKCASCCWVLGNGIKLFELLNNGVIDIRINLTCRSKAYYPYSNVLPGLQTIWPILWLTRLDLISIEKYSAQRQKGGPFNAVRGLFKELFQCFWWKVLFLKSKYGWLTDSEKILNIRIRIVVCIFVSHFDRFHWNAFDCKYMFKSYEICLKTDSEYKKKKKNVDELKSILLFL